MSIDFKYTPAKWDNQGAEPSENLKTNGYQPGYKPPAQVFNYLQNNTSNCLNELQTRTSNLDDIKVNKVEGKGLSTNDYTDEEKAKLGALDETISESVSNLETEITNLVNTKVDKVEGMGLSSNDYTDEEKAKLAALDETISESVSDLETEINSKANKDLSNVQNTIFAEKATGAGVGGETGKDLSGQTVSISHDYETGEDVTATAGTNAEIFNDYNERTYADVSELEFSHSRYGIKSGNIASGAYSHAEGYCTTASGYASHAEGHSATAIGPYSHAEGINAEASGQCAHAEGWGATASGSTSHAEGNDTTASGFYSHAEGWGATASGSTSHAEGYFTTAGNSYSHAEGFYTRATGEKSHAEGNSTIASGKLSHAEGSITTASGEYSHAEGYHTTASGNYSHAEGCESTASGAYSHAGGYDTIANYYQLVHGIYNKESDGPTGYTDRSGDLFIIGNGTIEAGSTTAIRANALRTTTAGKTYGLSNFAGSGADYAEYFEWLDGNPDNEDRRGYFVTLDGDKVKKATDKDSYILGVVSATPSLEGDSQSEIWNDMYLKDVFGEKLIETVEVEETTDESGRVIPAHTEKRWILNPEYDGSLEYENRENRKEWSPIGLIGKLIVIDDGTCQVNEYCTPNADGIATASDKGYRVMKRLDSNHVRILLK